MKKYLVDVKFSDKTSQIILFKAKNNIDLELKIIKNLRDIFNTFDEIEGFGYKQITKGMLSKKAPYYFIEDSWLGSACFDEVLNNGGRE